MSKELIYIKDNIENNHYVYTNELDIDYGFIKCYEWLCNRYKTKYPESVIDLRYTITDDKCDIFCQEEFIDKGWVWNSKDYKKRTLYELTKIPVCITVEKTSVYIQTIEPVKVFQETQTETQTHTQTQTQTQTETNSQQISTFVQTKSMPLKEESLQRTFLNKVYNQENSIDLFNYFDIGISDFSKWYMNELEPVITNISKLNLGNEGYAPNPFSPINSKNIFLQDNTESKPIKSDIYTTENDTVNCYQVLTNELKCRLTQPNYGLRSKKYD